MVGTLTIGSSMRSVPARSSLLSQDHALIYLGLAFDEDGNVIAMYVGKSINAPGRVASHNNEERKEKQNPGYRNLHYQTFAKAASVKYFPLVWLNAKNDKSALHLALLEALTCETLGSFCLVEGWLKRRAFRGGVALDIVGTNGTPCLEGPSSTVERLIGDKLYMSLLRKLGTAANTLNLLLANEDADPQEIDKATKEKDDLTQQLRKQKINLMTSGDFVVTIDFSFPSWTVLGHQYNSLCSAIQQLGSADTGVHELSVIAGHLPLEDQKQQQYLLSGDEVSKILYDGLGVRVGESGSKDFSIPLRTAKPYLSKLARKTLKLAFATLDEQLQQERLALAEEKQQEVELRLATTGKDPELIPQLD